MSSPVRSALARAQEFLLEPPAHGGLDAVFPDRPAPRVDGAEVAVVGLSAGCGVTTLAGGLALSRPSAVVRDVDSTDVTATGLAAKRADAIVLIAHAGSEPALAELVVSMLGERLDSVLLVANRVTDPPRWRGRAGVCVPESRLGAALLRRGRRPPGAFGAALAQLAELVDRSV
jgi:hypothetical protein